MHKGYMSKAMIVPALDHYVVLGNNGAQKPLLSVSLWFGNDTGNLTKQGTIEFQTGSVRATACECTVLMPLISIPRSPEFIVVLAVCGNIIRSPEQ